MSRLAEQLRHHFVWRRPVILPIDVPVGNEQIQPPIIVAIDELSSPSHRCLRITNQLVGNRNVFKAITCHVAIKRIVLVIKVANSEVQKPVTVYVAARDPHAPLGEPIRVQRTTPFQPTTD
jgi:hypothetical protein